MKQEFVDLVDKLVAFRSVASQPSEKRLVLEFAEKWFKENNITTKWFDSKNSPSLLATVKGLEKKTVVLVAHLDVVPAPDKMFITRVEGDKIFGRGVLDNKGCAAILMLVLKRLKKIDQKHPTVKLLLTTDEEEGGFEGVGKIIKMKNILKPDAVFIPDGGGENLIVTKEKGAIHLLADFRGKAAHGSRPWEGVNALDRGWEFLNALKKEINYNEKTIKNKWKSTISLGRVEGGEAINQVPDLAEFGIDIRFTEEVDPVELLKFIKKKIKKIGRIKKIILVDRFQSDEKDKIIMLYQKTVNNYFKGRVNFGFGHGASDARHFNNLGVPVWLHYPKGGEHHGDNEWISIDSVEKMIYALVDFFSNLRKSDF
ncbi:MAG TPA: M20 family metallopeptidase [Candidatus Moranbacteria bacterium]|nr:M20 family metallopeptidase [Candidatus Moranbacteria bacterium]